MEIIKWIDKSLNDVKSTLLYGKYFDSITLENVEEHYYLLNPNIGMDIMLTDSLVIKSIHIYSGKQERIKKFIDKLPLGLEFSFTRNYTRQLLGRPDISGGESESFLEQKIPFWDKYIMGNYSLHLQFSDDKSSIELITIGSLKYT